MGAGRDDRGEEQGMGTPEIDLNALAAGLGPAKLAEAADFIEWLRAKQERDLNAESQAWLGSVEPIEPYDWSGVDPMTLGEPVKFVEGIGAVVENG